MRFCAMALLSVWQTCSWPTTSLKRCGRYFRAMTWYDIYDLRFTIYERPASRGFVAIYPATRKSKIGNRKSQCQGDHGGCGANCRCCIPALAGFVSPHSMGPGGEIKPQDCRGSKQNPVRTERPIETGTLLAS